MVQQVRQKKPSRWNIPSQSNDDKEIEAAKGRSGFSRLSPANEDRHEKRTLAADKVLLFQLFMTICSGCYLMDERWHNFL